MSSSPNAYSVLSKDDSDTRSGGVPSTPLQFPATGISGGSGLGCRFLSLGLAEVKSRMAIRWAIAGRTAVAITLVSKANRNALRRVRVPRTPFLAPGFFDFSSDDLITGPV
jgi:hypothetical protein